jgi:hypothetical protein
VQCPGETDPVGVNTPVTGCAGHQCPDGVVGAQVPPCLLAGPLGRLGPQHHPGAALVGLQLVEGRLELPVSSVNTDFRR